MFQTVTSPWQVKTSTPKTGHRILANKWPFNRVNYIT